MRATDMRLPTGGGGGGGGGEGEEEEEGPAERKLSLEGGHVHVPLRDDREPPGDSELP